MTDLDVSRADGRLTPEAGGDVVLVDPAMTGRGFKQACARRGLRVIAVYTLTPEFLAGVDPGYASGDALSLHVTTVDAARAALPGTVRAVIPTTEPSVLLGDQLGAALGLPGNPLRLPRRMSILLLWTGNACSIDMANGNDCRASS